MLLKTRILSHLDVFFNREIEDPTVSVQGVSVLASVDYLSQVLCTCRLADASFQLRELLNAPLTGSYACFEQVVGPRKQPIFDETIEVVLELCLIFW